MFALLLMVGNSTEGVSTRLPGTSPPTDSGSCETTWAMEGPAPNNRSVPATARHAARARSASWWIWLAWSVIGKILEEIRCTSHRALDGGLQHHDRASPERGR